MTNYFRPLHLTVNGPATQFFERKVSGVVCKRNRKASRQRFCCYSIDVNTKLSVMKPIHARWLVGLYDHLQNKPEVIRKGFEMAGIVAAVTDDPFEDLVADH